MRSPAKQRPTIGFISTWPVYQGTTIDRYAHSLIQGISAAAGKHDCNLLLGCGFSITENFQQNRSFWPVPSPDVNFLPVGPWNTDGLIIVPDELLGEHARYVRDLLDSGFPVIFTTPEGPGPVVAVDNTLGISQAFAHLYEHGHRQIAFIAGNPGRGGDSEERLHAYQAALRDAGLPEEPRLIAFGEHRKDGGAAAMGQILESGAAFTALIASNDLSCLGAIQRLEAAGRRMPEDVAVIGFDDILDARSLSPSLTTIRHPTFSLGYQAVLTLLGHIRHERSAASRVVVPPRLIIRQSCGCSPVGSGLSSLPVKSAHPSHRLQDLARAMAETSLIEARNSPIEDLEAQCAAFIEALLASLRAQDAAAIMARIQDVMAWTDERDEDAHIWQAGMSILYQNSDTLSSLASGSDAAWVADLLDRIHLEISDQIQRRTTRAMLEHMDMMSQLGMLTAELLTAVNISESAEILARHVPRVGVRSLLVALYDGAGEEYTSHAEVLITAGLAGDQRGCAFETRKFPLAELYDPGERLQLIVLPLTMSANESGFAAFNASNPELCAAIVHNLSAALRNSRLYNDAVEGRRLAEEANRMKSRFLSTVSHELRTPLSLIVGLSEMVLRQQKDGPPRPKPELHDMEQINLSAQHLARLIGDVLDLASSEAGQLHILREPLDLTEVLRMTARVGEELAHGKGLTWSAEFPPETPWVMGDRTRLRQVTLNLISNAVKFTDAGRVQLDVELLPDEVVVSVSDTGLGISPSEQTTVFDEFYRSQNAIRSGYGGLGLGLAISKQLIEQHGGSLAVRSPGTLGDGSTFAFRLPTVPAGAGLQMDLQPDFAADRPQVVLVVDDDPRILDMHSRLIEQAGCQVITARNGRQALEAVERQIPDLILLDLMMPEMDGFEVLEELRSREAARDIPVIILTARALSAEDLERCNRGVATILGKGLFSAEETLKHIEAALTRRRPLGRATQQLVRKAMAYIHARYSEPLTREQIADHIGISPDYLTDCFHHELGVTPITYIRRYRIRQACDLLRSTPASITQVAMTVGFSDSAHFTRTFQREVGLTPRAYRDDKRA